MVYIVVLEATGESRESSSLSIRTKLFYLLASAKDGGMREHARDWIRAQA